MQEKRAAQMQAESSQAAGAREVPEISSEIEEDGPVDVRDMSEEEFMEWKLQVRVLLQIWPLLLLLLLLILLTFPSAQSAQLPHCYQGWACCSFDAPLSPMQLAQSSWRLMAGTDALDGTQLEGLCRNMHFSAHLLARPRCNN
jgi:hypothetical protein